MEFKIKHVYSALSCHRNLKSIALITGLQQFKAIQLHNATNQASWQPKTTVLPHLHIVSARNSYAKTATAMSEACAIEHRPSALRETQMTKPAWLHAKRALKDQPNRSR